MTTTTISPTMVVGGAAHEAADGATYESVNPATEEVVAVLPDASEADVDAAVAAARTAFEGEWRRTGPADRQRLILRLAGLVQDHAAELARLDSLEMGMPITRTTRLVGASVAFLEWYAAAARTIRGHTIENSRPADLISYSLREPIGVVGAITPWNTPLPMMMWKLGPVLATGSTLVHKPAEYSSLSALRVAELALEAGIPPGVVNVITGGGTAGAALAAHLGVDKVAFTGSVATGQAIVRASAGNIKRLTLELGGKSPNIVFADADLDAAAAGAAMSIFGNSGQVCVAGSRLLVERPVYDELLAKVAAHAAALRLGDPLDETTDLGPVASRSQLDRVRGYIDAGTTEGASLVHGGGPTTGPGYFVEPTIFGDVNDDMKIAQEEIFGPVLAATPFDSHEEALAHANSTDYGLSSYLWTNDLRTANRFISGIKAGTVQVNSVGNLDPAVPVGGVGVSGYGKELGLEQLDEYLVTKAVWVAR